MRVLAILSMTITVAAAGSTTAATHTITFDEFAAGNHGGTPITEEYSSLGVHFLTTDDGVIWDGASDGDPGGWGVDGTNGPQFLVFDGSSYSMTIEFDQPVTNVSFDITRLAGFDSDTFLNWSLYLDGVALAHLESGFPPFPLWLSYNTAPTLVVDEIQLTFSGGDPDAAHALDNLNWTTVPTPGALCIFGLAGLMRNRRRR